MRGVILLSEGKSPNVLVPLIFHLDPFVRDLSLNVESLDRVQEKIPPSEVKSLLENRGFSMPHIDLKEREQRGIRQSGFGFPPVLPDFYFCISALCNVYVLRAEFGHPSNTL